MIWSATAFERGDERGGPDPGKEGAAADMMNVTHKTTPFEV
jgi:hypothetical protein